MKPSSPHRPLTVSISSGYDLASNFHLPFALGSWANHLFLTPVPTFPLSLQSTCGPILDHWLCDSTLRSLFVLTPGSPTGRGWAQSATAPWKGAWASPLFNRNMIQAAYTLCRCVALTIVQRKQCLWMRNLAYDRVVMRLMCVNQTKPARGLGVRWFRAGLFHPLNR